MMQVRSRKHAEIDNKLIHYLDICTHKYPQDTCGVRCIFMENKILRFAEGLGLNDFKDSLCWISDTLNRNKKVVINLNDEANDITYQEKEIIMSEWRNDFYAKIV